jgi:hypothetical protein
VAVRGAGGELWRRRHSGVLGFEPRGSPGANWCAHAPPWHSRSTTTRAGSAEGHGGRASYGSGGGQNTGTARDIDSELQARTQAARGKGGEIDAHSVAHDGRRQLRSAALERIGRGDAAVVGDADEGEQRQQGSPAPAEGTGRGGGRRQTF